MSLLLYLTALLRNECITLYMKLGDSLIRTVDPLLEAHCTYYPRNINRSYNTTAEFIKLKYVNASIELTLSLQLLKKNEKKAFSFYKYMQHVLSEALFLYVGALHGTL